MAILSKYPIKNSVKKLFTNPMLLKTTSSGNTYYTFDKGFILSNVDCGGTNICILTHQGFPYRRFNSTPEKNKNIFDEFDNQIKKLNPNIITGDFNSENFMTMMSFTNEHYNKTINDITTLDGMKFDNILINKHIAYKSKLIKSLSDHYMVITEINLGKDNIYE